MAVQNLEKNGKMSLDLKTKDLNISYLTNSNISIQKAILTIKTKDLNIRFKKDKDYKQKLIYRLCIYFLPVNRGGL